MCFTVQRTNLSPVAPCRADKWIRTGFDDSTCGCSGNRIYVCGSFLSQDIGAQFLNILKASLTSSDQGFVAVPESNFCQ